MPPKSHRLQVQGPESDVVEALVANKDRIEPDQPTARRREACFTVVRVLVQLQRPSPQQCEVAAALIAQQYRNSRKLGGAACAAAVAIRPDRWRQQKKRGSSCGSGDTAWLAPSARIETLKNFNVFGFSLEADSQQSRFSVSLFFHNKQPKADSLRAKLALDGSTLPVRVDSQVCPDLDAAGRR